MAIPAAIQELVERFQNNRDAYRSAAYNEAQCRQEFINPFFLALGWDMDNQAGWSETYKDVIHEDAIKVGEATKAPDYCFRIGGARKFFAEAKRPSVDLKENVAPAYQLRRYAWTTKLPLSVLTDFAEFAVYDCRVRPEPTDKASTGRIFYATCDEYPQRWDDIAAIFSKDAVLKGRFDKFAESNKVKKGTADVDDEFLKEIESWRDLLARNFALRNPRLTHRELNFAVTRTIDRLIFLRICEGRGIEIYGRLQGLLNGAHVYARLGELFQRADERYNSGLFHFSKEKDRPEAPDSLTLSLALDDKPLKEIIENLYYPKSPYAFSALPAEVLGQVYEQFLGKVIRLTEGHHAVVEEKPEVKKAGGVYYTPAYIVDYIVKNTVGKLLGVGRVPSRGESTGESAGSGDPAYKALTPRQVSKLRILDPACGSGSFLIGAYQFLLDWHRDYYVQQMATGLTGFTGSKTGEQSIPAKNPVKNLPLYQSAGGEWKLTSDERKRILLNNIYGVDIDAQAVETTKLSLLLKVLEGENEQTISRQLQMFHQRALPDLGDNIKCGNSLIGPDFYAGQQMTLLDEEERLRVNAFDWNAEFAAIMKSGGFDAVIGNPPYVRIQGFPPEQIDYFSKHYRSAVKNCDLYVSFVERAFSLLKQGGWLGKIVPNKFFKTDYGEGLRGLLSERQGVAAIVDFGAEQVFDATTYTCLLFLCKQANPAFRYAQAEAQPQALQTMSFREKSAAQLSSKPWSFESGEVAALFAKLAVNSKRLLDLPADMSRGSSTGDDEVFVIESKNAELEAGILREPVFATDYGRYRFRPCGKWRVIFPYVCEESDVRLYGEGELAKKFPKTFAYLRSHQVALKARKQFKEWFGFSAPRNLDLHDKADIIVPLLANRGSFALVPKSRKGALCPMASGGFTIALGAECPLDAMYVLALLNSKLLFWKLEQLSNIFRGGWITCTKQYFGELPIRVINFSSTADKAAHDGLVGQVETMLALQSQKAAARTPEEVRALERQIAATDAGIDRQVYALYGLTEEEIKIVEGKA